MGFVVIVVNRKAQDGVRLVEMHTVTAYFNKNRRGNRIRIDGFSLVDLSLSICRNVFEDDSDLIMFFWPVYCGIDKCHCSGENTKKPYFQVVYSRFMCDI